MSNVTWFASQAEIATHLGTRATAIEIEWDATRALVRFRAPIDVSVDGIPPTDLALAILRINMALPMLVLELRDCLAFTTHVFLDEDSRISSTALDACVAAIAQCEATTKLELDKLREALPA